MTATLPVRTAVTTCAVPGRNHQAEYDLQLCRIHLDDLGEWLFDIEREFVLLDARPSMQANWNSSRGGRLASQQSPARIEPLVHTDRRRVPIADLTGLVGRDGTLSVLDTLHYWVDKIRSERELRVPGHWVVDRIPGRVGPFHDECVHPSCGRMRWRHFVTTPVTVKDERLFLSRHLEWAAERPWIGQMWTQIRLLRNQLQAVNGVGEQQVGRCPECDAWLHLAKPRYSSGRPVGEKVAWAVECDRDVTHRWEGAKLMLLRLEVDEQRDRR